MTVIACEIGEAVAGPANENNIEDPKDVDPLGAIWLDDAELFVLVAQWVNPLDRDGLDDFPCLWASKSVRFLTYPLTLLNDFSSAAPWIRCTQSQAKCSPPTEFHMRTRVGWLGAFD